MAATYVHRSSVYRRGETVIGLSYESYRHYARSFDVKIILSSDNIIHLRRIDMTYACPRYMIKYIF